MNLTASDIARFWSKVVVKGGACWGWTASTTHCGYGRFYFGGEANRRVVGAHRVSWFLTNGPIPTGLWVLHHCDNPPCSNPQHLFLGTHADNMADMATKGRAGQAGDLHLFRTRPEMIRRGEAVPTSCLTEKNVRELRAMRANGARLKSICTRFGISEAQASRIINRQQWRHVP